MIYFFLYIAEESRDQRVFVEQMEYLAWSINGFYTWYILLLFSFLSFLFWLEKCNIFPLLTKWMPRVANFRNFSTELTWHFGKDVKLNINISIYQYIMDFCCQSKAILFFPSLKIKFLFVLEHIISAWIWHIIKTKIFHKWN